MQLKIEPSTLIINDELQAHTIKPYLAREIIYWIQLFHYYLYYENVGTEFLFSAAHGGANVHGVHVVGQAETINLCLDGWLNDWSMNECVERELKSKAKSQGNIQSTHAES